MLWLVPQDPCTPGPLHPAARESEVAARRGTGWPPPRLRDTSNFSTGRACPEPGWLAHGHSTAFWFSVCEWRNAPSLQSSLGFQAVCVFPLFLRNAQNTVSPGAFGVGQNFLEIPSACRGRVRWSCGSPSSPGLSQRECGQGGCRASGSQETWGPLSGAVDPWEGLVGQQDSKNGSRKRQVGIQTRDLKRTQFGWLL